MTILFNMDTGIEPYRDNRDISSLRKLNRDMDRGRVKIHMDL
jgi:hypothetical protein